MAHLWLVIYNYGPFFGCKVTIVAPFMVVRLPLYPFYGWYLTLIAHFVVGMLPLSLLLRLVSYL